MTCPVDTMFEASALGQPLGQSAQGAGRNILVVDDDAAILGYLSELLVQFGYTVTLAENGEEGLRRYHESTPDLVLTDIVMPHLDGCGFIMALRRVDARLPIVAMSGGGRIPGVNSLEYSASLGANAVLLKPFGSEGLRDALEQAFQHFAEVAK